MNRRRNIDHSLLLKKAVHTLVLPHEDDVLSVQPDVKSTTETAANADQSEHEQFLRIEGKIHGEIRGEHRGDGFLPLEPDRQQSEHRGAAHGCEESSPVISHGEIDGGDLDAEEHPADGCRETRGHPDRASRREHLAVPALVLVDPLKAGDQFREKGRYDTGDMHEGTLFAQGQAGAQGGGQTYHLLEIRIGG